MKLRTRVGAVGLAMVLAAVLPAHAAAWPDGARIAINLTFDLDAETVWWDDPEAMTGNPSSLSMGHYGPTVALPKILAMLERQRVSATFFVPAWVAETYPDAVRSIAASGHEIGAHGVRHESPTSLTPAEEQDVLARSVRVLEEISGERPVGYRAPSWAISDASLRLASDDGFLYSSNRMDSDLPYVHADPAGLVELPVSWVLDDAPFFWFDEDTWNKKIHSAGDVLAIWQEEFTAAYAAGGYFDLTTHPQIIGRPARLAMLEDLIGWIKAHDGAWFATMQEVAEHVSSRTKQ